MKGEKQEEKESEREREKQEGEERVGVREGTEGGKG